MDDVEDNLQDRIDEIEEENADHTESWDEVIDDAFNEPDEHVGTNWNDDDMTGDLGDEGMNVDSIMTILQVLGVDVVEANRYAIAAMRAKSKPPTSFIEAYGRGGLIKLANKRRDLNLEGLAALDLRAESKDGTSWDFNKLSHRVEAKRFVEEMKPEWIIGSPPRTTCCSLSIGLNYPKMDPAKVELLVAEGRKHLRCVCELCSIQLRAGKHVLHEHPAVLDV